MIFRKFDISDMPLRKPSMKASISQILQTVDEAPEEAKVHILRQHDCLPLRQLLQACYDPRIKWLLPQGAPHYKPSNLTDIEGRLYQEAKHLYLFMEGGNPKLTNQKRGDIFIQMLESVTPEDAKLLIGIKDRELPYKTVTKELVQEAFPGLIP